MEIMGKAPRSSHYAETAGIFTAFFYRSKPYQAAASIARSRRPQDRTLFDRADAVKPLEDSPRCRWRTWNLCSCLLSPIPSTSGDHRGTSQGRSYYPPRGQERKDGKTGAVIGLDIVKDPLPRGFDLVLISNVFHGRGAKENRALLTRAYRSLNQGGRIILRDVLMSRAGTHPDWGALFSVSLLVHTPNGRCYALDEVRGWLRQAGFSGIQGPLRSSTLSFDPDSILIAAKN
jgi:O-methyltransferase domain